MKKAMRKIKHTLFAITFICCIPLLGMRTASHKRSYASLAKHTTKEDATLLANASATLQDYYKKALYLAPHIQFDSGTNDYENPHDERLLNLAKTYKASYTKLVWLQELALTLYSLQKEPANNELIVNATVTLRTFLHNLGYCTDADRFLSNSFCDNPTNTIATTTRQILNEQGTLLHKLTTLMHPFCDQQHPRVHRYYNLALGQPNGYRLVQQRLGLYDEIPSDSIQKCTLASEIKIDTEKCTSTTET